MAKQTDIMYGMAFACVVDILLFSLFSGDLGSAALYVAGVICLLCILGLRILIGEISDASDAKTE